MVEIQSRGLIESPVVLHPTFLAGFDRFFAAGSPGPEQHNIIEEKKAEAEVIHAPEISKPIELSDLIMPEADMPGIASKTIKLTRAREISIPSAMVNPFAHLQPRNLYVATQRAQTPVVDQTAFMQADTTRQAQSYIADYANLLVYAGADEVGAFYQGDPAYAPVQARNIVYHAPNTLDSSLPIPTIVQAPYEAVQDQAPAFVAAEPTPLAQTAQMLEIKEQVRYDFEPVSQPQAQEIPLYQAQTLELPAFEPLPQADIPVIEFSQARTYEMPTVESSEVAYDSFQPTVLDQPTISDQPNLNSLVDDIPVLDLTPKLTAYKAPEKEQEPPQFNEPNNYVKESTHPVDVNAQQSQSFDRQELTLSDEAPPFEGVQSEQDLSNVVKVDFTQNNYQMEREPNKKDDDRKPYQQKDQEPYRKIDEREPYQGTQDFNLEQSAYNIVQLPQVQFDLFDQTGIETRLYDSTNIQELPAPDFNVDPYQAKPVEFASTYVEPTQIEIEFPSYEGEANVYDSEVAQDDLFAPSIAEESIDSIIEGKPIAKKDSKVDAKEKNDYNSSEEAELETPSSEYAQEQSEASAAYEAESDSVMADLAFGVTTALAESISGLFSKKKEPEQLNQNDSTLYNDAPKEGARFCGSIGGSVTEEALDDIAKTNYEGAASREMCGLGADEVSSSIAAYDEAKDGKLYDNDDPANRKFCAMKIEELYEGRAVFDGVEKDVNKALTVTAEYRRNNLNNNDSSVGAVYSSKGGDNTALITVSNRSILAAIMARAMNEVKYDDDGNIREDVGGLGMNLLLETDQAIDGYESLQGDYGVMIKGIISGGIEDHKSDYMVQMVKRDADGKVVERYWPMSDKDADGKYLSITDELSSHYDDFDIELIRLEDVDVEKPWENENISQKLEDLNASYTLEQVTDVAGDNLGRVYYVGDSFEITEDDVNSVGRQTYQGLNKDEQATDIEIENNKLLGIVARNLEEQGLTAVMKSTSTQKDGKHLMDNGVYIKEVKEAKSDILGMHEFLDSRRLAVYLVKEGADDNSPIEVGYDPTRGLDFTPEVGARYRVIIGDGTDMSKATFDKSNNCPARAFYKTGDIAHLAKGIEVKKDDGHTMQGLLDHMLQKAQLTNNATFQYMVDNKPVAASYRPQVGDQVAFRPLN